jgi:hypothetical protein
VDVAETVDLGDGVDSVDLVAGSGAAAPARSTPSTKSIPSTLVRAPPVYEHVDGSSSEIFHNRIDFSLHS